MERGRGPPRKPHPSKLDDTGGSAGVDESEGPARGPVAAGRGRAGGRGRVALVDGRRLALEDDWRLDLVDGLRTGLVSTRGRGGGHVREAGSSGRVDVFGGARSCPTRLLMIMLGVRLLARHFRRMSSSSRMQAMGHLLAFVSALMFSCPDYLLCSG